MNLFVHPIAQAQFDGTAVGTVVTKPEKLLQFIKDTVEANPEVFPANGQGFFMMNEPARTMVTAGVALRTFNPEDYIPREHRGVVDSYIRRDRVNRMDLIPDGVAAIVYTIDAYINDPETTDKEKEALVKGGITHVLVTILAFKGPKPPQSVIRFVLNLAGANARYQEMTADEIRAEAKEVADYHKVWCTVG
jgi:hypothetical protein